MQSHVIKAQKFEQEMQAPPQITIFEQSMQINDKYDDIDQEELCNSDNEVQETQINTENPNLLLSKYQHNNTIIEDENEEGILDDSLKNQSCSKPFLMSISMQNASLYRFPTLEQEKSIRADITNIEAINNVLYYYIETKSSQLGFIVKVKRRYNDFKYLLRELSIRYPWLILPYLPIKIGHLNAKDVEDRKRLLQNAINIITMHQELILSQSVRNFFEEGDQQEFENKRRLGQINIKAGLAQNLQFVIDKSFKSFGQLKNWWNGINQKNEQLDQIQNELQNLLNQQTKYYILLGQLQQLQKKQQKIQDILTLQDSQKNQLLLETKLQDSVLDYTKQLDFYTNTLEDKLDIFYQQQIWQLLNIIQFIDYANIYYKQLLHQIDDFNEQLKTVSPNQQTHQTIKDEITKYICKAKEQFCNKDGIVMKYLWTQQQVFSDFYYNQQQEIWRYAAERKLNEQINQ